MILVLKTTGKSESVDTVNITLWETRQDADEYCRQNTDESMEEKYWSYAEIIPEGIDIEPTRYENFWKAEK